MAQTPLWKAIDAARERLGLSKTEYARRLDLTPQALDKIEAGGGVNGDTLARLQDQGGVRLTKKLIASLKRAA